jgi:hypothetical protein
MLKRLIVTERIKPASRQRMCDSSGVVTLDSACSALGITDLL